MQSKIYAVLTTLVGVLLFLPLLGIETFGNVTEGISAWIIAIAIVVIGIVGITKSFKQ